MPRIRKRRAYGRPRTRAPQKRRVFSDNGAEGCVKITVGRNRVVIWNNCNSEITIAPGKGLKLASRVRYELDYASATAIFAEPMRPREETPYDEAPSPKDYDWV